MSETMVERVAKAIYEKFEDRPKYAKIQMNGILAAELARAAIEAMRDPDDAMNFAGQMIGDYPWDGKKPSRIFTAMISAALATPAPERMK